MRPSKTTAGALALVLALSLLTALRLPAQASTPGQWLLTGAMTSGHGIPHGAPFAKLQNGKVIAVSGNGSSGLTTVSELYDSTTGQWSRTGSTNQPRWGFSNAVALHNGKVLIAGGHDPNVVDYASAELYDPATGEWTFTGSLNTPRRHLVVVGLQDGRVLAATGAFGPPDCGRFLNSAELYDPTTGQWTYTGTAPVQRESADAILLNDGRVMVVGGYTCGDFFTPETDLYNPATGTWSRAGDRPHGGGGMALANLQDGRVLMVGGAAPNGPPLAEAFLFNPATDQWETTSSPHFPRTNADAITLPDGKILVAGGGPLESEIYDPATATWTIDAALNTSHNLGRMTMLDTGDILMTGGYTDAGPSSTVSEIYRRAVDEFGFPMPLERRTRLNDFDIPGTPRGKTKCFGVAYAETFHAGEDWFAPQSTQITSVGVGRVTYVSPSAVDYPGAVVIVEHSMRDGSNIFSMYGHLDPSKLRVQKNQTVSRGTAIADGLVFQKDNNVHLHWEMRYFEDGTDIRTAPNYKKTCSGPAGPGYTYPGRPTNFVANGGAGPTFRWTDPSDFVSFN